MKRLLMIALGLLAGSASAQSPLEALELDVVDQREHPDDAIERMANRPKDDDDDDDLGSRHLKLDWSLGAVDEIPVISGGTLAPLPVEETPTLLEESADRGHGLGNAFGKSDDKGHDDDDHGGGEGKGDDKDDGDDRDDGDRDDDDGGRGKDDDRDDKDDDKGGGKKGGDG